MALFRNLFMLNIACLFLGNVWLSACNPLSTSTSSSPKLTAKSPTSALTATPILSPTQTEKPTLIPTPDIWEIPKCHRASDVLEIESGWIWQYTGDIDGHGKVEMLLNFTEDNQILGFAFDFQNVREYQVSGCVEEQVFTLWLQQDNNVDAIIRGEFPTTDPRGNYSSSSVLSFDVMTGSLLEKDNLESFPVYLRVSSGTFGTMDHRFQLAGTEDDDLILNASQQFISAVASNDRTQVIEMLRFPVEIWMNGARAEMRTPEMFLEYYNSIFGDGFKERLAITFPNYLRANAGNFVGTISQSIYGGGGLVFDEYGKVTAIFNWEEPTATPTATISP